MTEIPTLPLAVLFAALCLTATGCNKEAEPEERIGAKPEYVESHEALAAQVIALSNRFVDTMLSARSEEAARAAVAKLSNTTT